MGPGARGGGRRAQGVLKFPAGESQVYVRGTARKEGLARGAKPKMSNFLSWHEADSLPEVDEGKGWGRREASVPLLYSPLLPLPLPPLQG